MAYEVQKVVMVGGVTDLEMSASNFSEGEKAF